MADMRAAAAKIANMERPQSSSQERTNRSQPNRRDYNTRANAPGRRPSGYEGRSNEPSSQAGFIQRSNEPQPEPARGNNNERSNPPGNAAPNTGPGGTAPRPSTRAPGGAQRNPITGPTEPVPAQIAQPIGGVPVPLEGARGGDRFARATARAKAKLRGGVTS